VAAALNGLGRVAHAQANYQEATTLLQESLELRRELEEKQNLAITLNSLGRLLTAQGDYLQAAALFRESLSLRQDIGGRRGIAEALEGSAAVAIAQGQAEQAARLLGRAAALREAIGAPVPPIEHADYERNLTQVRASLSDTAFRVAWAEGEAMA
jgi:tetratricopeptide (TPR) repeat protein